MIQLLRRLFLLITTVLFFQQAVLSQSPGAAFEVLPAVPDKLLGRISGKSDKIQDRITRQTQRYLARLSREERKLQIKLATIDSSAARQIFQDAQQQYSRLQQGVKNKAGSAASKYMPHLDSLHTALQFLNHSAAPLKGIPATNGKLQQAIGSLDGLQTRFNQAEEVNNYIKHRRQFLQEQLGKFGMAKDLQKYKKQVYYYRAQVQEYKRIFNDPSRLEAKALQVLQQTPLFKDFFRKHSQLAGMFNLPGNSTINTTAPFAGLQTREAVQQVIAQRFGQGVDVQQTVQRQVQGGQLQLSQLKDKINKLGGGSSDMEMPDFKPNNQKVRSWKNRLELGTNLQTVKSNRFFPSTSDIGLSLGYKLNDKSTVGVGGSYKMGWGKDIRHISISHQGVGMRSFLDYKIKGSFWISGGGELNYRSQFSSFEVLHNYSGWQQSALLGISKKYKVSSKIKGNAQIMYDFLWKQQVPRTQPIIFRVGYNLK